MVTWTVVTVMGNIIWADTLNFQCYFCVIIQGAIEMALNNNMKETFARKTEIIKI